MEDSKTTLTHDDLQALSIFINSFNRRPDRHIYYSEKLLTQKQKDDYETAIFKLEKIFFEHKQK